VFKDLDQGCKVIIFVSILTTFEASIIFLGSVKNQNTISKFSLPLSMNHTEVVVLDLIFVVDPLSPEIVSTDPQNV